MTELDQLTVPQGLGAMRRELIAEGFSPSAADDLIRMAYQANLHNGEPLAVNREFLRNEGERS